MQPHTTTYETPSLWQLLITSDNPNDARPLTCEQCWAIMEFLADCGAAGMSPTAVKRAADKYLSCCPPCRVEFDQKIAVIEHLS